MSGPVIFDEDEDMDDVEIIIPSSECVFLLEEDEDTPDIELFIPGPPGPPLKDVGTRILPSVVTATIAAPLYRRQRSFITGSGGPVFNPVIANPSDNGAWELFLFCTDDTNSVTLESGTNLQLSGQWIGGNGSILALQWDGQSQYVEASRNEI